MYGFYFAYDFWFALGPKIIIRKDDFILSPPSGEWKVNLRPNTRFATDSFHKKEDTRQQNKNSPQPAHTHTKVHGALVKRKL
jgi:hypothetical protein